MQHSGHGRGKGEAGEAEVDVFLSGLHNVDSFFTRVGAAIGSTTISPSLVPSLIQAAARLQSSRLQSFEPKPIHPAAGGERGSVGFT